MRWELSEKDESVWRGRTQERVIAAINDTSGRLDSVFLIGHSWCVGPAIFLSWRIMIFVYMVVTLLVLHFRRAFIIFEISTGIYVAQVIALFFTILSSTIAYVVIRREEAHGIHERVIWPHERLKDVNSRKQSVQVATRRSTDHAKHAVTRIINLLALLFTQNCCAIVIFWNFVFWFKVQGIESESGASHINDLLLHFYNLIPVLYEIVVGCAAFPMACYLPGTVAVIYILMQINTASIKDMSPPRQMPGWGWRQKEEWHLTAWLFQMFLIFIVCCYFLTLTQQARQKLIRSF